MEVLNKEKVLELAKKLIDEGKIDRAIVEYRRLLAIDSTDMRLKLRIAELLARQKKVSEAVKAYKEVADSYTNDGFYLKAVTVYKSILRLNPSLMEVNYSLAELYEKMGLSKDSIHQYQILSNTLEQRGDYVGLADVRKKIVALDPHNVANRIRLAETYQYQGDEEKALDEYEALISEVKGARKNEQLMELYEKILSYRPDNIDMLRSLCKLYYKRGEWKKIIGRLEKKDELLEGQVDLIEMQGEIYGRLNQIETAKNKFRQVADIYLESNQLDKALGAYAEMLVLAPNDEDGIKELVDEIDPDLFEKVKELSIDKKKKLVKMQEEQQEQGEPQEEGEEKPSIMKPTAKVSMSESEITSELRKAISAYELGKAYFNMGLESEAEPELAKALDICKLLLGAGYSGKDVDSMVSQIEKWIGKRVEATPPTFEKEDTIDLESKPSVSEPVMQPSDEETIDLGTKTEVKEKPKVEAEVKVEKKEEKPQTKEEKKKTKPKKKKDKRMGFV